MAGWTTEWGIFTEVFTEAKPLPHILSQHWYYQKGLQWMSLRCSKPFVWIQTLRPSYYLHTRVVKNDIFSFWATSSFPSQCLLKSFKGSTVCFVMSEHLTYQGSRVWTCLVLCGFIRQCLCALSQTNPGFSMAKATKKSVYPTTDMYPSPSNAKSKNVKTRHEPKAQMVDKMVGKPSSRSSGKVWRPKLSKCLSPGIARSSATPKSLLTWYQSLPQPKAFLQSLSHILSFQRLTCPCNLTLLSSQVKKITKKGKKTPPSIPKRKASEKIATSTKKNKKVRGKKELIAHYHQLMEELTKTDPDESSLDIFDTETSGLESQ